MKDMLWVLAKSAGRSRASKLNYRTRDCKTTHNLSSVQLDFEEEVITRDPATSIDHQVPQAIT